MSLLGSVHHKLAYVPRIEALVKAFSGEIRPGDSVLDVGCGSGILGGELAKAISDLRVEGVDTHPRGGEPIKVRGFDGKKLPFDDGAFDVVILADVLHHDRDPVAVLKECGRVAKRTVIVKDHLKHGWYTNLKLCFLDWAANNPHGVECLYTYWSLPEWNEMFAKASLEPRSTTTSMKLYHWSLDFIFGGRLHLLAFNRPLTGD